MERAYQSVAVPRGVMLNGVGNAQYSEQNWWTSMETIAPEISQEATASGWDWQAILNNTTEFLQALVVSDQQRQLIKANLERAKMGLAPLNASEVGMGLSVGVDANTRKMLMIFGGGALLVAAFAIYNSGRRR